MRPAFLVCGNDEVLSPAPCQKVTDDGDDCKDQQQVDRETGDMQNGEATNPQKHKNDSQDKKHFAFFLCCNLAALSAHGCNR